MKRIMNVVNNRTTTSSTADVNRADGLGAILFIQPEWPYDIKRFGWSQDLTDRGWL